MRHLAGYSSVSGVEIVALCDVNERHLRASEALVADLGGRRPTIYKDWRRMLERENLDALSITTAHPKQTEIALAACAASKDFLLDGPRRSLVDLARLRDAAQEGRRLAGQVYNARFAGAADARTEITSSTLDTLKVARARREVAVSDLGYDDYGDERGCESLLFSPVEEFDYARGVLDVSALQSVSCVTVRGARSDELLRAGLRYEFETAKGPKTIELEVLAVPDIDPTTVYGEPANVDYGAAQGFGIINFAGGGAGFTVRSSQADEFGRATVPSAWHNFVECVRSRRTADLIAPLSEFTASLEMLQLAKLSLESGRVTVFPSESSGTKSSPRTT